MRRKVKRKGSSLILVIGLLAIISILGGAAVTTSSSTSLNTISQVNSEQAYFTARSAVDTTIKYIQKYQNDTAKMGVLTSNIGTGTLSDMGDFSVKVTSVSSSSLKVSATSTYKGKRSTVVAYLSKAVSLPSLVPTDYLIYLDGNVNNENLNPGVVNGPVYVNGSFYLSYGSAIKGKLIATGPISITWGSATTNGIIGFGDVTLDGGGSIDGEARVGGNVNFSGGAPKIISPSKLYYQGALSYAWGTASTWVPGGSFKTTNYTPLDLSSYTGVALPIIYAPNITNTATFLNKRITSSGIITTSMFSGLNYNGIVTIDTSSQDISLIINSTFNPQNGLDFEVTGIGDGSKPLKNIK